MAVLMGFNAKLTVNGTEVCFRRASITPAVDSQDVSKTGANAQFRLRAAGMRACDLVIERQLNQDGENPYSDPPNFVEGQEIAEVKIFPDRADATQFHRWSAMLVVSPTRQIDIESPTADTINLQSIGVYYPPVG